uniref:Mfa1 family fimbria major subunit n=1 Tax=Bacteroides fragilis TaxID=817 RepID=UPI00356651C8
MERKLFSKVIMTMTAAAVMGLASCSNENDPMGGDLTPQGEPTSMKLVLDLSGGAYTRAINDGNSKTEETTIEKLQVYIYNDKGIFEKEHEIPFADLKEVAGQDNQYATTNILEATTGKKTIYVGANMTAGMKQIMKANSVQALAKKGVGATLSDITTDNKFVMFSTTAAGNTFVATAADQADNIPADNQVKVTLQRLAAKIAVGMTADLAGQGVQQGAAGEITDLGFLVDNINKMYYLTYGGVNGVNPPAATDANMLVKDYNKVDFEFADWQNTPQFKTITPGTTEKANWNIAYAAENLTTDKVIEGVTRIVVRGQFTPKSGIKVDGNAGQRTFAETANHITKGTNYIMFNLPEAGGYAFFKEADATEEILKEWLTSIGITDADKQNEAIAAKVLYTQGMNYWWITVDDNRGDIKRNNFYRADIKSIWAPGRNNGEFGNDDKDDVVDEKTNITVQITVEPWNLKEFNADLRP